jgi:farnesyl diphosphate synthase
MAVELFEAGGIEGMVGGQWLDLEAEGRTLSLQELMQVHRGKTGALIRAACRLGAMAARGATPQLEALTSYGEDVGLAFQIADDVLDATGTSEELGKPAGRDAELSKSTYVALMGIDGARAEAQRLAHRAVTHLECAGVPADALSVYCKQDVIAELGPLPPPILIPRERSERGTLPAGSETRRLDPSLRSG